jgi:hypothetical protein
MRNKIAAAKTYVQTHKKLIALGVTMTTIIALQNNGIKSLNEFLKENDLFDKYYQMDEI